MKHIEYQQHHTRVVAGLAFLGLVLGGIASNELAPPIARAADELAPQVKEKADDKVHGPQFCVPKEPDDENGEASYFFDRVVQTDEDDEKQEFLCPVVRDAVQGTLRDAWVRVVNEVDPGRGQGTGNRPDEEDELECCIYSVSLGGSHVDMDCESTDQEGFTSLHFDLDGFTEYEYGQYVVSCELGPDDAIVGYRMSEVP